MNIRKADNPVLDRHFVLKSEAAIDVRVINSHFMDISAAAAAAEGMGDIHAF